MAAIENCGKCQLCSEINNESVMAWLALASWRNSVKYRRRNGEGNVNGIDGENDSAVRSISTCKLKHRNIGIGVKMKGGAQWRRNVRIGI
jgi:hypothetical protein